MTLFWLCIVCALGMTIAQDVFAGAPVFHYGWYNALNIAFFVVAATSRQREPLAVLGCAAVVFAGAAAGLMAPDTHTIVGAPGASVRDDETGSSIAFPISGSNVTITRGTSSFTVDGGRKYTGALVMWLQPRDVVDVAVADLRGNNLTITQPTNASFLSPVLLMQQTTAIAGMNVLFDTFSVPAARANIRAVLFSQQQAAQLHTDPPIVQRPAVLFDVSDQSDRELPGGIGIVPSGERRKIAGLVFGAAVRQYPALVIASAPYWPVVVLGLLACAAGAYRSAEKRAKAA